jgi:hypothetical protein
MSEAITVYDVSTDEIRELSQEDYTALEKQIECYRLTRDILRALDRSFRTPSAVDRHLVMLREMRSLIQPIAHLQVRPGDE